MNNSKRAVTDVLSPEQRRLCMARIRSSGTQPERSLHEALKQLWSEGYRYRLQLDILGRPDFAFPKERVAIFVDGCFFHGCRDHFVSPKANSKFWHDKIESNKQRDLKVNAELTRQGWRVLRFWEHEIEEEIGNAFKLIVGALESANESKRS